MALTSKGNRLPPTKARKTNSAWMRWCLVAGVIVLTLSGLVVSSLGRQPAFYRRTLAQDRSALEKSGEEFEERALDWFNRTKKIGKWSAEFTSEQVNGWLATDFVQKFPNSLPTNVSDPRVDLQDEELTLAIKWRWSIFSGIAVVRADVFCTGGPGEIGVRWKGASTGWLPLPLKLIGDRIAKGLENGGFQTRWTDISGDPVLLVVPPAKYRVVERAQITIRSISIHAGALNFSGDTTAR